MVSSGKRSGRGRWTIACGLAAAGLVWGATGQGLADPPRYTFTDLGTLGGPTSWASAVNDDGTVVGWADIAPETVPPHHAFMYVDGRMIDLNPTGGWGGAHGINNAGLIVGQDGGDGSRGFQYAQGSYTVLPSPMRGFAGVNNSGQIVSSDNSLANMTYVLSDGVITTIAGFKGSKINDSGVIVGDRLEQAVSSSNQPMIRAVAYSGGILTELGTLGGNESRAFDINGGGDIIGITTTSGDLNSAYGVMKAFFYHDGQMTDLGTPTGYSAAWAWGINDRGDVVGDALNMGPGHPDAMLWQKGNIYKISDLAVDFQGAYIDFATDINNHGQIVGWAIMGEVGGGGAHAFLMTPLPDRPTGAGQSTWATDGSGSWGTIAQGYGVNWGTGQGSPGLDPGFKATDTATFGDAVTSGTAIVSLDGASPSLAGIAFDNSAATYQIVTGSRGTIRLENGNSPATISVVSGSHEIAASLSGSAIMKIGDGVLFLSGSNTYSGGTDIVAGSLVAGSLRAFGTGAVTVESGATLDITGQRIANAIVNHGGTLIGVSTLSGDVSESQTFANVTVADNLTISSGTTTFAAPVSGDVTVQSGAAATFADVLNAAVSVQGDVTIAGPAGATAAIDIASGGSVTFADGASYAGASISNDGSVLIDTSSTFTFTTGIVGTGSVSMIGSGVLDLAGTNPYLGPTFVDQGTLLVNGNLTNSDVTIAVDGILGGSGSIGGDVVVEGTLSPGNSPGLLTVAGLTLLDSSTTFMQIEGSGRGTHYDAVDVTGAARLGGGLVLDLIASFGENATFELFHFNGGVDGHFSSLTARGGYGNLTFLRTAPTTWSFVTATGDLFRFDESSGNLGVVVHQTPEPSTWAMLATGAAVAGWHARRRGRRPAGVQ